MSYISNPIPYSHEYEINELYISDNSSNLAEYDTACVYDNSQNIPLNLYEEDEITVLETIQKASSTAASYLYTVSKVAFCVTATAFLASMRNSSEEETRCSEASSISVLSISSIVAISSVALGILTNCVGKIIKQVDSSNRYENLDYLERNGEPSHEQRRGSKEYQIKRNSGHFLPLRQGMTYIVDNQ